MMFKQVQIWQYLSAASSFQSVLKENASVLFCALGHCSLLLPGMCKIPFLATEDESSRAQSWICQGFALPDLPFSSSLWSSPAISAYLPVPELPEPSKLEIII